MILRRIGKRCVVLAPPVFTVHQGEGRFGFPGRFSDSGDKKGKMDVRAVETQWGMGYHEMCSVREYGL